MRDCWGGLSFTVSLRVGLQEFAVRVFAGGLGTCARMRGKRVLERSVQLRCSGGDSVLSSSRVCVFLLTTRLLCL